MIHGDTNQPAIRSARGDDLGDPGDNLITSLTDDDEKNIREQLDQTSRIVLIQPGTDLVEHIAALLGYPRKMR